eukprot:12197427-Alexandrium_andersonii.AAC.1
MPAASQCRWEPCQHRSCAMPVPCLRHDHDRTAASSCLCCADARREVPVPRNACTEPPPPLSCACILP